MFEVGDIVKVVNNKHLGLSYNIGDTFKIKSVNDGTIGLEGKPFEYGINHFELDVVYLRTLKINKIKERIKNVVI